MRDIKFRAWDKQNNCWYQPVFEAYRGNLFELLMNFSGRLGAHTMEGMKDESLFPGRFEIQQFTGLKDRNGKDIYEGDVLAIVTVVGEGWSDKPTALKSEYIVEFDKGRFHFGGWGFDNAFVQQMEVIGNIYEGESHAAGA